MATRRMKVDPATAAQLRGDVRPDIRERFFVVPDLACEICGCTDEEACEGGCTWVSEDPAVCSNCALEPEALLGAM